MVRFHLPRQRKADCEIKNYRYVARYSSLVLTAHMPQRAQNISLFASSTVIGLGLVVLMAFLFCGHLQMIGFPTGANGVECTKAILLMHSPSEKNGILSYGIFLISLIVLIFFVIRKFVSKHFSDTFLSRLLFSFAVTQLFPKPYNPLLEALRKGILYPQIYHITIIAS